MSKYRNQLPLLEDRFFMTDGGLETSLIFHQGVELPYFASYDLLKTETGTALIETEFFMVLWRGEDRIAYLFDNQQLPFLERVSDTGAGTNRGEIMTLSLAGEKMTAAYSGKSFLMHKSNGPSLGDKQ